MSEIVHIVLDTSGSMVEASKQHSSIYLLLSLRRFFKEHDIPVAEWQWKDTLSPLEKIPSISWGGTLDAYGLSSFLEEGEEGSSPKTVILLSDGDVPMDMDVRRREQCFLLLLGEEDSGLQWHFPKDRLWLPQGLNGHLSLFLRRHLGRVTDEV